MNLAAILSELHAERRRIVSEIQSLERLVGPERQIQTDRRRSRGHRGNLYPMGLRKSRVTPKK